MRTRVGFSGGTTLNPTYRNIGDHTETVDIEFDPHQTSYETLLNFFWNWHNPTTSHNRQYMSAVFYHDDEQRSLAEKTRDEQQWHPARPIVTTIAKATPFYEAENYHQKYRLRQHPMILDKLGLSDSELIKSTVACRLNGYLGGFGSLDDFTKEQGDFGLPETSLTYIRRQIEKNHQ